MSGLTVSSTNSSGYVEVLHLRDLIAPTALSDLPAPDASGSSGGVFRHPGRRLGGVARRRP